MLPVVPIILIARALLAASSGGGGASGNSGPPKYASTGRTFLWGVLVFQWGILVCVVASDLVDLSASQTTLGGALTLGTELAAALVAGAMLFFAWPILRRVARLGRPRLVYVLAHLCLIFPRTGETYAGAALLAAIALAHRGHVTKAERDWVASRIAKQERPLGTYAAAVAMHQMLESRAAREKGRHAAALDCWERAYALLGTLTYASKRGVPRGVLAFARGVLALQAARRGAWMGVTAEEADDLGAAGKALRRWAEERLRDSPPAVMTEVWRMRAKNPVVESLFARHREQRPVSTPEAHARATECYLALARGEPVGLSAILGLLVVFDALLHPEFPETLIPEELRRDEDALAAFHEEVAAAVATSLLRFEFPIGALRAYGPISARVHQRLEQSHFESLEKACRAIDERVKVGLRHSKADEWFEASVVRRLYRRLELTLGTQAAARVWPTYAHSYCRLGVHLSETYPRMRPLAHAVFSSLQQDAERFGDAAHVELEARNMAVTAGVE